MSALSPFLRNGWHVDLVSNSEETKIDVSDFEKKTWFS